jgi:arabinofuranosyltransferase
MRSVALPRTAIAGLGCVAFALILGCNSARYYPFISDDSLISLRYAARLLEGQGLTWSAGRPVEGYSNLLWVLSSAALGALGVDLVVACRVLGAVCMLIAAFAIGRPGAERGVLPGLLGIALLACTGPIAVWTIGGLEQPMVAALLAVALRATFELIDAPLSRRARTVAGLAFGLLCLTRPDSPIFVAVTVVCLAAFGRSRRALGIGTLCWLALVPAGFVLAQLGFRLWYYGEWVSNSALVKVAFSSRRVDEGVSYVLEGFRNLRPFTELAAIALGLGLSRAASRVRCVVLAANALVWVAYLVVVGGDIFPAHRHFVVLVVLMTFALVEGFQVLERAGRPWLPIASALAACAVGFFLWRDQPDQEANRRAIHERWEWDGGSIGLLLRDAFKPQGAVVAVTAAGCIPYWAELDAIDMLGLNDHYLAHHPPPDLGNGALAHEHGDGAYLMARAPDLIVFDLGGPPRFRTGTELLRDRRFTRGYQKVDFETRRPTKHAGYFYVKRDSARIGIRKTDQGLWIPGFLMRGGQPAVADGSGTLVGRVRAGDLAYVDLDRRVPPGVLRVVSTPRGAAAARIDERNPRRLRVVVTEGEAVTVEGIVIEGAK